MKVSIYKNIADTTGAPGDLMAFMTTDKWRDLSLAIRAEKDKEKRTRLKKDLPCCTPSGLFRERKKNGLIKHSGLICIDIDGDDNPTVNDWQGQVSQLGHIREVMFAGLSVSGNGAFCLIRIADPTQHERHFKAIEEDFWRYGIIVDKACKDVSRLRFYSHNDAYYLNEQATTYTRLYRPPKQMDKFVSNGDDVSKLVEKIVSTHTNIVPDYHAWFEVAGALANVSGGREMFHAISRIDAAKYDPRKCDKQFDAVSGGKGIGISTLFYHAKNKGITLK